MKTILTKFKAVLNGSVLIILVQLSAHHALAGNHTGEALKYFKDSYEEADMEFEISANSIQQKYKNTERIDFKYAQGVIKALYWPALKSKDSKSLLVVMSGTHGVEGFVGSAVQRWLMDQQFVHERSNTDIILIHGVNVFGMKNKRRVNEDNIDLNRNFILDRDNVESVQKSAFKIDDSAYTNLNDFLNSTHSAEHGVWANIKFIFSAALKILQYGMENLRNPILQGQYTHSKGVFYGGQKNAPQAEMVQSIIDKYIKGYNKIFLVDLHTGYGVRGKLHLIAGDKKEDADLYIKTVFAENEIDYGNSKSFYTIHGEFVKYFEAKILKKTDSFVGDKKLTNLIFEYGTLDSQKTFGSIESLRRMVVENQNYWHPARSHDDSVKIKTDFVNMFNPPETAWRAEIIPQTDYAFKKIITWLESK